MALQISPIGNDQFFNSNGQLLVGGKIFTYLAGTSTKTPVYTDILGAGSHTNPIVLNAFGMPSTPIYLIIGASYKFVLAPATDTDPPTSPIYTWDNISLPAQPALSQLVNEDIPTFVSTTSFSVPGDRASVYHVGRRVQLISTIGTFYGWIIAVTFVTATTVTVVLDSGVLDASLHTVSYSFLTTVGSVIPDMRHVLLNTFFAGDIDAVGDINAKDFTISGSSVIPVGLGPLPWSGRLAPPLWVFANGQDNLLNNTYSDLLDVALDVLINGGLTYVNGTGANKVDFATTDVDTGANTITETAHGLSNGQRLYLTSTTTIPAGLASHTKYFVVGVTANTFQLALTSGGAPIDITSQGTGTHSFYKAFLVADVRGRVPMGVDNMGGVDAARVTSASTGGANADTLGGVGGAQTHTLVHSEIPDSSGVGGLVLKLGLTNAGGGAHSNTQPWIALNYIIYAGV